MKSRRTDSLMQILRSTQSSSEVATSDKSKGNCCRLRQEARHKQLREEQKLKRMMSRHEN